MAVGTKRDGGRAPAANSRGSGLGRRFGKLFALVGASLALGGCSGVAALNALSPRLGVKATDDLAYMPGPRGGVDVYAPTRAKDAPVIVFFYGGGWDEGKRADYAFVGRSLAAKGFVTVIPDYRLYPEVVWPAFLQDNAKAVRWSVDNAARFGGDPRRLFLMGHSAGAYNAMMLALDPRWLEAVGLTPSDLRGAIGLAGPYDFLPLQSAELKTIFGPKDQRAQTQPINYVTRQEPPLFLGVDLGDKVVWPKNTYNLAAKVRAAGGEVEVREYKGLSHALLIGAVAPPLRLLAPVLKDIVAFVRAHEGPAT